MKQMRTGLKLKVNMALYESGQLHDRFGETEKKKTEEKADVCDLMSDAGIRLVKRTDARGWRT